jgi:hypothetical protein
VELYECGAGVVSTFCFIYAHMYMESLILIKIFILDVTYDGQRRGANVGIFFFFSVEALLGVRLGMRMKNSWKMSMSRACVPQMRNTNIINTRRAKVPKYQ